MNKSKLMFLRKIFSLTGSIVILCFLLWIIASYQDYVQFTDAGLEAAVRENLERPYGLLPRVDLRRITHLDASGRGIVDLGGIENLRGLVVLNLQDNKVADLRPLSDLARLSHLNLRNNSIINLNDVHIAALYNHNLKSLDLSINQVKADNNRRLKLKDISSLSFLSHLEELRLRDNAVSDISPLADLKMLKTLDLRGNSLNHIEPLEYLSLLEELNLRDNQITDLRFLGKLTNLNYLNIHSNYYVGSVEFLASLENLETLIARNVSLGTDIKYLDGMTGLRRLNIRNCDISDVNVINQIIDKGALTGHDSVASTLDIRENPVNWNQDYDYSCENWMQISNRNPAYVPPECMIEPPSFSRSGGIFKNSFDLKISHSDPEALIVYTLDGSVPDINNFQGTSYVYKNKYPKNTGGPVGELFQQQYQSHLYNDPIHVSDRSHYPDRLTHIATVAGKKTEFPADPVNKGFVVRAKAYKQGKIPSQPVTHTYFYNPGVMNELPILALSIQEDSLFDYYMGIYVPGVDYEDWWRKNPDLDVQGLYYRIPGNYSRRGSAWEVEVNMEYYDPLSQSPQINQMLGLRIHGRDSRGFSPVKNFRLYARDDYEPSGVVQHQFFSDSATFASNPDNVFFKRLLVRNHSFFEGIGHLIMLPVYEGVQRVRPVKNYINGEYWGLAFIRDRFDEYHLAYNYDLDPGNIVILDSIYGHGHEEHIDAGRLSDLEVYRQLSEFVIYNNMNKQHNYDKLKDMLDIRSYSDFIITKVYFSDDAWHGSEHFSLWRVRKPSDDHFGDGRWRFFTWDFDNGFWKHRNLLYDALDPQGCGTFECIPARTVFFRNMVESDEFRFYFINRFADLINTVFRPDRIEKILLQQYKIIKPQLEKHYNRWGIEIAPETMIRHYINYARERPCIQRKHIRKQFGIDNDIEIVINVSNESDGYIRINTLDIKDGLPGIQGQTYPWKGIYFKDIPIELEAIPYKGKRFKGWKVEETGKYCKQYDEQGFYYREAVLNLNPTSGKSITAIFESN